VAEGSAVALLIYQCPDGSWPERELGDRTCLGADAANDLRLPAELGVVGMHATIARSAVYQVPVLIDRAGEAAATRVNGRRVAGLKALRHRDEIRLGSARLVYWELVLRRLADDSPLVGARCLVCYDPFLGGDEVITCPRCRSADHHKECWGYLSHCARDACDYPVQEAMRRGLSRWVRFERLEEETDLIRTRKVCAAGRPRDEGGFKAGDHVSWCPDCQSPFHAECWFVLPRCPECGHHIDGLIRAALTPGQTPAEGGACD
jgi:hypothetical protein